MTTSSTPSSGGIWPPPLGNDMDNDGYHTPTRTPCSDATCPVPHISHSHRSGPPGGYTSHTPSASPSATTAPPRPPALPTTSGPSGDTVAAYVALGVGVLLLGVLLLVAARRRRRT